jgi:hypothetical protein
MRIAPKYFLRRSNAALEHALARVHSLPRLWKKFIPGFAREVLQNADLTKNIACFSPSFEAEYRAIQGGFCSYEVRNAASH